MRGCIKALCINFDILTVSLGWGFSFYAYFFRGGGAWSEQADGEFDEKSTMAVAQEKMEKSSESVQSSLETLRTGRARYGKAAK